MKKKFKIGIWGVIPNNAYSGGRYSAWVMAEALAMRGHEVTFFSNNYPVFDEDFKDCAGHDLIEVIESPFKDPFICNKVVDLLIIVPSLAQNHSMFYQALDYAKRVLAKVVLYNFETPNWYNENSVIKKDPSLWNGWKLVAKYSNAVLSISNEGTKYAKEFYKETNPNLKYGTVLLAINQVVADQVKERSLPKQKKIFIPLRLKNADHKGGNLIEEILTDDLSGFTIVLMVGKFQMTKEMYQRVISKAKKHNICIDFYSNLSDEQKFMQIASSQAVLFPSSFEGYGYPPLEAIYMGTHCICYDLPVLREVGEKSYTFSKLDDLNDFKQKLKKIVRDKPRIDFDEHLYNVASMDRYSSDLDSFIKSVMEQEMAPQLVSWTVPREKLIAPKSKLTKTYIKGLIRLAIDYLKGRKNWIYQE